MTFEEAQAVFGPIHDRLQEAAAALLDLRDEVRLHRMEDVGLKRAQYWEQLYKGGSIIPGWITKLIEGGEVKLPDHMVQDVRIHAEAMGVAVQVVGSDVPGSRTLRAI
jgi:hypothetical protein